VADESAFGPETPGCPTGGGCGGVIGVDAYFGDQSAFFTGLPGLVKDPIDVAVDRREAPKAVPRPPGARVERIRNFALVEEEYADVDGETLGFFRMTFSGVREGAKLRLECLNDCNSDIPKKIESRKIRRSDKGKFEFEFENRYDEVYFGNFRVVAYVKPKKNDDVIYKSRFKTFQLTPGPGERFFRETTPKPGEGMNCLKPGRSKVSSKTIVRCRNEKKR